MEVISYRPHLVVALNDISQLSRVAHSIVDLCIRGTDRRVEVSGRRMNRMRRRRGQGGGDRTLETDVMGEQLHMRQIVRAAESLPPLPSAMHCGSDRAGRRRRERVVDDARAVYGTAANGQG